MKKIDWFKEKNEFFKDKPKKISKKNKEFTPERTIKLATSLALVGVGTAVALDLLTD